MGVRKNWVGLNFGKLTVLKEDKNSLFIWVKCSCGSPVFKVRKSATKGNTKSCGCLKKEHHYEKRKLKYFGKSFGCLTILSQHSVKKLASGKTKVLVDCLCSCSQKVVLRLERVVSGHTKSCGCIGTDIRRKATISRGANAKDETLSRIQKRIRFQAKIRDLTFKLTKKHLEDLVFNPCYYCGQISNIYITKNVLNKGKTVRYNGLDRLDNNKGYTPTNVVPCCWFCNRAKFTNSKKEFLLWVERIGKFKNI